MHARMSVLCAHSHAQAQWGCLLCQVEFSSYSIKFLPDTCRVNIPYNCHQILSHPPSLLRLCKSLLCSFVCSFVCLPWSSRCIGQGEFADHNQVDLPCPVSVRVLGLDFCFVGFIHSPMSNCKQYYVISKEYFLSSDSSCSLVYICIYQRQLHVIQH